MIKQIMKKHRFHIITFPHPVIAGLTRNPLVSLQGIPASAGMTRWGNGMTALIAMTLYPFTIHVSHFTNK